MEGLPAVVAPSKTYMDSHTSKPYFLFDKSDIIKEPVCMICSMEESVKNKVLSCNPVESTARKKLPRMKLLAKCTYPGYNVVAHTYNPKESIRLQNSLPFKV